MSNTKERLNAFMKKFRTSALVNFTENHEVVAYGWRPTEMKKQVSALINAEVTAVLDELEEQSIDANYYIPNSPDDTYTSGDVVRVKAIQSIKERYNG